MKTLGEYLVENGWISQQQLQAALAKQAQVGGRLGTCLLETGAIGETLLLKALSLQSGAPTASAADLADIPPEAIALLPSKVAATHLAVPFRVLGNQVDVAVTDLGDLTRLDELSFVLGSRVRLHVASEAGIRQALERYYQIPCPSRYRHLRQPGSRRVDAPAATIPKAAPRPERAPPEPPPPPTTASDSAARPRPVKKKSIPLTPEEESALWGEAGRPLPTLLAPPDSAPADALDFGEQLAAAKSPEEVGTALLGALSEHFLRILLFRVSRHKISGWMHWGPKIDARRFEKYSARLDQPTVFRQIQASQTFFLGKLDGGPGHAELARARGGDTQTECVVFPLLVRERLAGATCCDRGALGVQGVDLAAVRDLCARAGLALERLILERKLRR